MDGDQNYAGTKIEVPGVSDDLVYEDFVGHMIAKHGRFEMLHRDLLIPTTDTLFMEGLLVDEQDGPQYQAVEVAYNGSRIEGLYCLVPVIDVLWARARLEGLYSESNRDQVLADDR